MILRLNRIGRNPRAAHKLRAILKRRHFSLLTSVVKRYKAFIGLELHGFHKLPKLPLVTPQNHAFHRWRMPNMQGSTNQGTMHTTSVAAMRLPD